MWTFQSVVKTEQAWGIWNALVTLSNSGVPESFYLKFDSQPTDAQAVAAASDLANRKNVEGGIPVSVSIPPPPSREIGLQNFIDRLTTTELATIYAAATAVNPVIVAVLKRIEMRTTVNLDAQITKDWLAALVQKGLLTSARATEILGP